MKPFNLEAALSGENIVTRKGMPIVNWVHWPDALEASQILVLHPDGMVTTHFADGRVFANRNNKCDSDLFLAEYCPKKLTRWINIYRDPHSGERMTGTKLYKSEEAAAHAASVALSGIHITVLKVEWEEV